MKRTTFLVLVTAHCGLIISAPDEFVHWLDEEAQTNDENSRNATDINVPYSAGNHRINKRADNASDGSVDDCKKCCANNCYCPPDPCNQPTCVTVPPKCCQSCDCCEPCPKNECCPKTCCDLPKIFVDPCCKSQQSSGSRRPPAPKPRIVYYPVPYYDYYGVPEQPHYAPQPAPNYGVHSSYQVPNHEVHSQQVPNKEETYYSF